MASEVEMKDYVDALFEADRRRVDEAIKRLDQATQAAEKAAALALSSAEKAQDKHNELIRKGENERAEFASKAEVGLIRDEVSLMRSSLAKVAGAAAVLAVLVSFIIRLAGIG